jgi:type VI secretion system secreted protein Hcp
MPIYMNFDKLKIKGDVTAAKHEHWIELNSLQFGVGRGISSPVGSSDDRESSSPSVSEITCSKAQDVASAELFKEALEGEGVPVTIVFVKTDKKELEPYITIELTNTMISGYSMSSGGDRPSESISLNFTKFEFKSVAMDEKGSTHTKKSFTYDMTKAKVV